MIVYITVNKITKAFYIGITNGNKKYYLGSGKALNDSFKKYKRKNFRRFTLEKCSDRKTASNREKYWIEYAKNKWPNRKCLNLTNGGENEYTLNKESINKIKIKLRKFYKDRPELKQKYKEHAKNTINKYIKENGPWNKGTRKTLLPRKNGNKGVNNRAAKLKEKDVLNIRKLNKTNKYLQKDIAIMYSVHQNLISRIVNKKIWKHI
jgi:predicted GIY-YIG superfamily endonuclease